jgi:ribosomal protein L3 glutamine methyltransferase
LQLTTLNDVLTWAEGIFKQANLCYGHGTNNAWDEAVAIASYVFKLAPNAKKSELTRVLKPLDIKKYVSLVKKRIELRIPVPYLTKEVWFAGLKFFINQDVIIPRSPIGELILNRLKPWHGVRPVHRILDLCTGSGCLAILCAKIFKNATIDAVDISHSALAVAKRNIKYHACAHKVRLIEADLFSRCQGTYDIIISNPPYVSKNEYSKLPQEYYWEPKLALEADLKGMAIVKQILKQAPQYLTDKGLLFVEVGNSALAVQKKYPQFPFTWVTFERGGSGVFLLKAEDKACWQVS